MTATIVPARLGHVLRVARQLDPELLAKAGSIGIDARLLMRDRWAESREAWALLIDGKAVAVGGWRGALLAGEAEAWVSLTQEARAHRFALARAVARHARRLLDRGVSIKAWTIALDGRDRRFVEWCGFDRDGEPRQGIQWFHLAAGSVVMVEAGNGT